MAVFSLNPQACTELIPKSCKSNCARAMQCTRQGSETEEAIHVRSHEQPKLGRTSFQTVLKSFVHITIPQTLMTVI